MNPSPGQSSRLLARPRVLVFFAGLCLLCPLIAAISMARNLPAKGNYDEIRAHGMASDGKVGFVREDHDINDDYWHVITFTYSHDSNDHQGIAYSTMKLKTGDSVAVRYVGNDAVLADVTPIDIDRFTIFLLSFFSLSLIILPVSGAVFIATIASFYSRRESFSIP
jgi:hypothetical protein